MISLCTLVLPPASHTQYVWAHSKGECLAQMLIPAPIMEHTHSIVPQVTAVSPYPCFLSSISFFLQCSKDPPGPKETFTFHHFRNLALSSLPHLLRMWFHNCFNLTKVPDATARGISPSCIPAISPGSSQGWSQGQVGRGWETWAYSAWRREGEGGGYTCCLSSPM